ncbi:MAG: hypothetical protein LC722_07085, partial [Actinobacteria bacterium]|nr:hypothetical protein [Actinomycetota bacterium]
MGLWTLRAFAFALRSSAADVVSFWLPMYTELGRRLGAGDLPAWTSSVAGGMPFAADPHSGWMQALPMALFVMTGPARAIAWLVALLPVAAGLGIYAFLRAEGLSRPGSALAGVGLTMAIATARLGTTVRFPGVVAWTVISLACAARMMRARRWEARLLWVLATALAWGQVAGAHLTAGGAIGGGALIAYLLAASIRAVRAGDLTRRTAAALGAILLGALVLVNLAVLLPRAALVGRTSLAGGYDEISARSLELTGEASPDYPGHTGDARWPLNFATIPGAYLGAAVLMLAGSAWWSRRHRALVTGFSAFGATAFLFTLHPVAHGVERLLGSLPLVDQYLHGPEWLSLGVLISLAVLAAVGLDAWRQPTAGARRWLMLVPGALVWLALPAVWGPEVVLGPILIGTAALIGVLALGTRGAIWLSLIPALAAAELLAPSLIERGRSLDARLPSIPPSLEILYRRAPSVVDLREYVAPGAIALALSGTDGRVTAIGRSSGAPSREVATLANNESELYGLGFETTGTYRAVQLDRYWTLLRALHREPIRYNRANVHRPDPRFLQLLGGDRGLRGDRSRACPRHGGRDPAGVAAGAQRVGPGMAGHGRRTPSRRRARRLLRAGSVRPGGSVGGRADLRRSLDRARTPRLRTGDPGARRGGGLVPAPRAAFGVRRGAAGLVVASLLVASAGVVVLDARLHEVRLESGDGLGLRLSGSGGVRGIVDRGRELGTGGARGGFSLRAAGGQPNLLHNPGFEDQDEALPKGWSIREGSGDLRIDDAESHSGERSLRISLPARGMSTAATARLEVEPDAEYTLTAWIMTEGVRPTGTTASANPARVSILQPDGTANFAYGYTDDSEWTRHDAGFRTGPDVREVSIGVEIAGGSGTAWFDELSVARLLDDHEFAV